MPIFEGVDRLAASLMGASPEMQESAIESTAAQLRLSWGADFDACIAAIDDVAAHATAASPALADLLDAYTWMLVDATVMTHLDTIAQYRARRSKWPCVANAWVVSGLAAHRDSSGPVHDLRHSFASNLLETGVDIVTGSKALGHANFHITLTTYAHAEGSPRSERSHGGAHEPEWKQFGNSRL